MAFDDVRFQTADGVQLAAWVMPHPLHGLGLNVLAFDFRGHGDSEGPTSTSGCREVDYLRAAVAYMNDKWTRLESIAEVLQGKKPRRKRCNLGPLSLLWKVGLWATLETPRRKAAKPRKP